MNSRIPEARFGKKVEVCVDDDCRSAARAPSVHSYSHGPTMTSSTVVVARVILMTSANTVIGYCIIQIT